MQKNRLEAFSDGMLAIFITIMVLEMQVPHEPTWAALQATWPVLLSYILSFLYIGIYWNNHHHMLQLTQKINGSVLWGNLHLLFWLSLLPFTTAWMGENHFAPLTLLLYGLNLLCCALAYFMLQTLIIRLEGTDSPLAHAIGRDTKGKLSVLLYIAGIGSSLVLPWLAGLLYALTALIWLIPDRRIERELASHNTTSSDSA
jgi:uncharacterized membrane protein